MGCLAFPSPSLDSIGVQRLRFITAIRLHDQDRAIPPERSGFVRVLSRPTSNVARIAEQAGICAM